MESIVGRFMQAANSATRRGGSTGSAALDRVATAIGSNPMLGGGMFPGLLASMTGAAGSVSQVNMGAHAEQYRHYTGWVYSSVRIIAQSIAAQPMHVAKLPRAASGGFKRTKDFGGRGKLYAPNGVYSKDCAARQIWMKRHLPSGLKGHYENAELLETHPILECIQNPNPLMSRSALMYVTSVSIELTGKSFWWVAFNDAHDPKDPNSLPISIWYLPSHWVEPIHVPGELFKAWRVIPDGVGSPFYIPRQHMIYFNSPDPSNPFGTYSNLQAQARAVISDEAIAEAQRQTFQRGIFPGYAVTIGGLPDEDGGGGDGDAPLLTKPQRQQIVGIIKRAYQGAVNFDEPIILDRLIKRIDKITQSPAEMGFRDSGDYTKGKITQSYGVNPIVMGQIEQANRASAAAAKENLYDIAVNPRINMISETLTMFVGGAFSTPSDRLLLFIEECVASDPDSDRAIVETLGKQGAIMRNEARATFHYAPLPNGDNFFIQENVKMVPVEMTPDEFNAMTPKTVNGKVTVDDPDTPQDESLTGNPADPANADQDAPSVPAVADKPKALTGGRKNFTAAFPDTRMCDTFDCGVAEVRAVCEYYGMCPQWADADFTVALKAGAVTGTTPAHIKNFFLHHGCAVEEHSAMSLWALWQHVEGKGYPTLCPVQHADPDGTKHGHWVTVTGVTKVTDAATGADSYAVEYHCSVDGMKTATGEDWLLNWTDTEADGTARVRYMLAVGPPPGHGAETTEAG